MSSVDYSEKARRIIADNCYMVLATSTPHGQPWITPVYYAFTSEYQFYWYSRKTAKHSRLISRNQRIAVTIFSSAPPDADQGAVYMSGHAYELSALELPPALATYAQREHAGNPTQQAAFIASPEDFITESPLRMYMFRPRNMYVSNESTKWHGKWIDTRRRIS